MLLNSTRSLHRQNQAIIYSPDYLTEIAVEGACEIFRLVNPKPYTQKLNQESPHICRATLTAQIKTHSSCREATLHENQQLICQLLATTATVRSTC